MYGQGNLHFVKFMDLEMWRSGLLVEADFSGDKVAVKFYPIIDNEIGMELAKGEQYKKIMSEFAARNEEVKNGKWYDGWKDFCFNSPHNYNYEWAIEVYVNPDGYPNPKEPLKHYIDTETHLDVMLELFKTFNHTNE